MYEFINHLNITVVVLFLPFLPMMALAVLIQLNIYRKHRIQSSVAFYSVVFTVICSLSVGFMTFRFAPWVNEIWHKSLELNPFFDSGKTFPDMWQVMPMLIGILAASIPITIWTLKLNRTAV